MTNKAMFAKSIDPKICPVSFEAARSLALFLLILVTVEGAYAQDDTAEFDRTGRLIQISLPITGSSAAATIQQIKQVASGMPAAVRAEERAVLVLEFDTNDERSGQGSDLGACVSLAEFLVGEELKSIRTVAWIPDNNVTTALVGHAILPAISCNEIAMDKNASLGNANIDQDSVPRYVNDIYRGIAQQRLTLPVPLVLAMLNPKEQLERVTTSTKTVFATASQRKELQKTGEVTEFATVSAAGEPTILSSQQMEDFRLIRHRTSSRNDLARRFNVSSVELRPAIESTRKWTAVRYQMPSLISAGEVSWLIRALDRKLLGETDLVILEFGDVSADDGAAFRLAEHLAAYNRNKTKTVAWISGNCEGVAGVVALACDDLFFGPEGVLGAGEQALPSPAELESFEITARSVARQKERDWSLLMAVINPNMVVKKYRSIEANSFRVMGKAEYDELPELEAAKWFPMEKVDIRDGVDAELAEQLEISQVTVAPSLDVVKAQFQLVAPPESLEPTRTERWLEDFAMFLNNPVISMMLVFGAFTCFMNELSAPGVGVFGFLGVVLLAAFFWSHHLEGNAAWFEILLFIIGVVFVAIELFVVPGFGLFGIGGIAMIICSLILAGQDFIVPRSEADFEKLSLSLLPILGAFFGIVVGAIFLQKVLPNSPVLRRLTLSPPQQREPLIDGKDPEAVVDWGFLAGSRGEAVTPIMPSGKARIEGRVYDVMSRGEVVQKGESIEVVEAIANRVVVRKI